VVVLGLYLVVWGKSKEYKARNHIHMPPSPTKEDSLHDQQQQLPVTILMKLNWSFTVKKNVTVVAKIKCVLALYKETLIGFTIFKEIMTMI
jgi:hypothetical protein